MRLSCVMSLELSLKVSAASGWRPKQPWLRMKECPLLVSNLCTRPRQSSIDCTERMPTAPQKDLCPPFLRSLSRRHTRCSEKCTRSGPFWSLPLLLYYVATYTLEVCNVQVEPGIPALQVQSLFHTMANGSIGMCFPANLCQHLPHTPRARIYSCRSVLCLRSVMPAGLFMELLTTSICSDIKQELLHMNKELLFSFQELLSVLIDQPCSSSNRVSDIGALLRQMHHLLNMLRPHQVRIGSL